LVTIPAGGAIYAVGQIVDSSFSCIDGLGGPGISSCADQHGHASSTAIDTSTAGSHTLSVTAVSSDGLTGSSSITYTVAAPPSVSITRPTRGARYTLGQKVRARFSCHEGVGGPGLASCRGQAASGEPLDTSRPGEDSFKVTATSTDGQVTTRTVSYGVVLARQRLLARPRLMARCDGSLTVTAKLPGPGRVDVLVTAWVDNLATLSAALRPAPGRFVFARAQAIATHKTTVHILVKPDRRGRRLVTSHRYRVTLRVWVTYAPTGGRVRSFGYYGLHLPSSQVESASPPGDSECSGDNDD
jgi:hypothetical protein